MEENLITKESRQSSDMVYIASGSSPAQGSVQASNAFSVTPDDLVAIVNLYKERDENMNDIRHFSDPNVIKGENEGIDYLLKALATDKTQGISSIDNREEVFGSNKVFRKPPPSFWEFVVEALSDKMIIILICCSIFEIGISLFYIYGQEEKDNMDWIDGTSIIIAVFVVVSVGSVTNYKKEMKFHTLNDVQNEQTKYNVIRKGQPYPLTSDQILVGDLIKINYGDILPADMILVEGNGIKIDESSLTGESNAVTKKPYEKCKEEYESGNHKPSSMILLSGTDVIEGSGSAIAIAIGAHSQKGIIRGTIDNAQEDNKTPLENKLNDIADMIGYFGLGSAILTFIALSIQMLYRYLTKEEFTFPDMIKKVLTIIILCVSIIVVAIPEGLPLAVTLSLAFSIKKLMDNNNLVRKMHACETMGGANIICTDKTGTLTLNLMSVTNIVTSDEVIKVPTSIKVENLNLKKQGDLSGKLRAEHSELFENEDYWDTLYSAIALNVDCTIKKLPERDNNGDTETVETKNKTDKGFIEFLLQYKSPVSTKRDEFLSDPENYQISPFDSKKKRMTTYIKTKDGYRLYTKGGAENAMNYCNRYINKNTGQVSNLNDDIKNYVTEQIDEMNKNMMRTLYLCYRDIDESEYNSCNEPDENGLLVDQKDLIFIGIFCLRDILRNGIQYSVNECHQAGVSVIMVTGDNLITATSIAKECNIFPEKIDLKNLRPRDVEQNPNEINDPDKKNDHIEYLLNVQPYAMTGNSFYAAIEGIYCQVCGKDTQQCTCPKSEAEAKEIEKQTKQKLPVKKDAIRNMDNFKKISTNLLVMARSQPIHKYALVLGLKSLENVVAVTGDGTNDAPALSKSDVGFSMVDGTDIAKEASDIIIMDNNFASIVTSIMYGRSIYENIRKFLQFQLTVNFCACILVFICSCVGNETPLNSIQMLWVNLIMDSLGSLALATEPPYRELLRRKPTNRKESIINGRMWKHIVFQSIFEIAILLVLYFIAPRFVPEYKKNILDSHQTLIDCFGQLPGNGNKDNILYGNKDQWSKDVVTTVENKDGTLFQKCEFMLLSGAHFNDTTLYDAYPHYMNKYGGTTHMTLIFDVFVCYTLFNQINCRIIDDSFNTFKRISKGILFICVTSIELAIQIALSQFGYKVFHCVENGLTFYQWLICMAISLSTMIFNIFIKIIPLEKVIDPWTKGKIEQENVERARTTINQMVNQNLKD